MEKHAEAHQAPPSYDSATTSGPPGYPVNQQPPAYNSMNDKIPERPTVPCVPAPGYCLPSAPPAMAAGERYWAYEMFFCFSDLPTCCGQMFCPCVVEYLTARKANLKKLGMWLAVVTVTCIMLSIVVNCMYTDMMQQQVETINTMNEPRRRHSGNDWFLLQVLCYALGMISLARFCMGLYLRSQIRSKFNIGPNRGMMGNLEDAVCVFCCYDCVMCQNKSTMDKFEREGLIYDSAPMVHA